MYRNGEEEKKKLTTLSHEKYNTKCCEELLGERITKCGKHQFAAIVRFLEGFSPTPSFYTIIFLSIFIRLYMITYPITNQIIKLIFRKRKKKSHRIVESSNRMKTPFVLV